MSAALRIENLYAGYGQAGVLEGVSISVEPGEIVVGLGASSTDIRVSHSVQLTGAPRAVGFDRAFHPSFDEVARSGA